MEFKADRLTESREEKSPEAAAAALIGRVLPQYAGNFRTVLLPPAFRATEQGDDAENRGGVDRYAIDSDGEKIVLEGTSAVCLAKAFYGYLKRYCGVNLSWCGNRNIEVTETPLPGERTEKTILQKYRSYMNYCTFAYSAAVWDWKRWEKEIDFMAMNGINMPLAVMGTDAVWYQTLLDLGFSGKEALEYISGPAFWPWQLMTNIDSYLAPPDLSYLAKRLELGRKIIGREKELGMIPLMQGYSGHIPRRIKEKYPEISVLETPSWCGFPPTCQIDPADPMFSVAGRTFLENQRKMLGEGRFLCCDPFHENVPPAASEGILERTAQAIDSLYRSFSEESVWVMQSWSIHRDIVIHIPKGRLLVLDINGHRFQDTDGFWGHDFILGDISNFGGKNSLHGDIRMLAGDTCAADPRKWQGRSFRELQEKWPGLCGEGLYMEGINQNPLYFEMGFDHLTREGKADLEAWTADYGRRRYGRSRREDVQALRLLEETCYAPGTSDCERGSVICARPDLTVKCAAPNDVIGQRYDNRKLLKVLDLLLGDTEQVTDGFRFDICDFTRQLLSNHARVIFHDMTDAARKRDRERFLRKKEAFLNLILEMDGLLSTREELRLSRWVSRAMSLGSNGEEKDYYRRNVLALITIWGPGENPKIFDYAWREWGGMLKEYYYARWNLFLTEVEEHFETYPAEHPEDVKKAYDRCAFRAEPVFDRMADLELHFIDTYLPGKEEEKGDTDRDTLDEAERLIARYRNDILACEYMGGAEPGGDNLDFWDENRSRGN